MENRPKLKFAPIVHFRNPGKWRRDPTELYHETIDNIVMAEDLGYDAMYITEHHFTDDDWAPSPLMLLSAIAMRTRRIRLGTFVGLLPFYHPVRLAEDGAVLDILSGGRYEFGFGLGYRPEEFMGYGMEMKQRSRRADEMLEIIRRSVGRRNGHLQGQILSVREDQADAAPGAAAAPADVYRRLCSQRRQAGRADGRRVAFRRAGERQDLS